MSAERESLHKTSEHTHQRDRERRSGRFFVLPLFICVFSESKSCFFLKRERENTFCFPGVLQLSAKRERERERNLLFFFLTFSWMPPSFSSSSKGILEQDSVELLEIELRRLTNAVEKLEESNRYLEKAIEEEEEEADLDIYRRAIKENAKAIPEHQSKIFEISQRIRELKPSQRGEDRKDDGSAWL